MVSATTLIERIVSLVLAVWGCYYFWSLRTTNYGFVCTNLFSSLFSSLFSHLGWHSTGEKVILVRTGDHRDDTEFEASSARFSHVCKILHNLEGFYLADSCFFSPQSIAMAALPPNVLVSQQQQFDANSTRHLEARKLIVSRSELQQVTISSSRARRSCQSQGTVP